MKRFSSLIKFHKLLFLFPLGLAVTQIVSAQDYRFGIQLNPVVSWFNTDIDEVDNEGSRAGFNFGFSAERYFNDNFAFTGGISITNSGGRLKCINPNTFRFSNYTSVVAAGNPIIYRVQFLSVPAGLKYKTDEIGLLSYFAGFGFDPKMVIRGRVDIPSLDIKGQKAMTEIRRFNFGYHLEGGVDYSIDGNISVILGLGFENNLIDLTKDIGDQKTDRTSQKFLKFIFGVNF